MNKKIQSVALLFCLAYMALAIIGVVINYSPVPYWDMWNGYLQFFTRALEGDTGVWLSQHNEHRIFLSRILFFIDNYVFSGNQIFLLSINILLIFSAATLFLYIARDIQRTYGINQDIINLVITFNTAILFAWIQHENITWGFQSQFFLAQTLPLLSFYLLFLSYEEKSINLFLVSVLLGTLSSLTMANGVLALPVMVVMSICLKMQFRYTAALMVLSLITFAGYFTNYTSPESHGSIKSLFDHPAEASKYLLLYLGSPFYHASGATRISIYIAQFFGLLLIVSSAILAILALIKNRKIDFILITFIVYVGGTALGTAAGRSLLGIEPALSSRYATPVLMCWISFLIMATTHLRTYSKNHILALSSLLFLILIALLPNQLKALKTSVNSHERLHAALAIELGINDQQSIEKVFPSAEWTLKYLNSAISNNYSIFGHPSIRDAQTLIGQFVNEIPQKKCQGHLDEITVITNETKMSFARGWIFDQTSLTSDKSAIVINQNNQIIGYLITGLKRPDVKQLVHEKAELSGFTGYINTLLSDKKITIIQSNCHLDVQFKKPIYSVNKDTNISKGEFLLASNINFHKNWLGKDYEKSSIDKMLISGSYIHSDSDVASVTLTIKNNQKLLYKSGPSTGGIFLEFEGKKYPIEVSREWQSLKFEFSDNEPKSVTIHDQGQAWGQWIAIGLLKD